MSEPSGRFVWYELLTTDTPGAQRFYGAVAGWGTQPGPVPDMDYTLLTAAGIPVGGVMPQPPEARQAGAPPGWNGVVGVADVDAAAAQAVQLGATLCMPPTDIPTVGRYAGIMDPQGAALSLFTPGGPGPDHPMPGPGTEGHFGWHELRTAGWQAAFGFYEAMFGWQKGEAIDMGPMGTYQIVTAGGQQFGGFCDKQPATVMPSWLYYITVNDIDAAAARVKDAGGTVTDGPHAVPGGEWILHGTDPQGAAFALVGKRI